MEPKFKARVEKALPMGIDSINDLAESCVIQNIKAGKLEAAKYWLENNLLKYHRPKKPKDVEMQTHHGIATFTTVAPDKNGNYPSEAYVKQKVQEEILKNTIDPDKE